MTSVLYTTSAPCGPSSRDVDRAEVLLDRHAAGDPVLEAAQLLVDVDDVLLELVPAGERAAAGAVPGRGLLDAEEPGGDAGWVGDDLPDIVGRAMRAVERSDAIGCLSSTAGVLATTGGRRVVR